MSTATPDVHFADWGFEELTPREVHDLMRLRSAVFVVEQECVFLDIDGHDPESRHLIGRSRGQVVAYARWYASEGVTVLGRIVTDPALRGSGAGKALMAEALRRIGDGPVTLNAQEHLQRFYGAFGFVASGDVYLEDGIPHVRMDRLVNQE